MSWGNPIAPAVTLVEGSPEWVAHVGRDSAEWIAYRDKLGAKWEAEKVVLAAAKESEMTSRKAFADFIAPPENRKSGVNNVDLGGGFVAKVTHKITHKVVASNKEVADAEDLAEKVGNEGSFLFERIITFKPEFHVTEYKKLEGDNPTHMEIKKIIDTLIEQGTGAPSLEIKAPKATLNG